MRGFLGGAAIGALVSGLGAALASLAVPLPQTIEVSSENPPVSDAPEVETPVPVEPVSRDADLVEVVPVAPKDEPSGDSLAALDPSALAPAARPDIGGATQRLETAALSTPVTPDVGQGATEPVLNLGAGLASPDAPVQDSQPQVETAAPAPLPPEPEPIDPEPTETEVVVGELAPEPPTSAIQAPETQDPEPVRPEETEAQPAPVEDAVAEDAPVAPDEPVDAVPVIVENDVPAIPPAPETQPVAPQIAVTSPEIAAPSLGAGLPGLTLPQVTEQPAVRTLPDTEGAAASDEAATENRPRVGTPGVQLGTAGNTSDQGTTSTSDADLSLPAFVRNSEEFIALDDRPLMSIVLLDEVDGTGAEALEDFPYPLSFAIRADDPNATAKVQARRDAGFEVLMLVDLPRDAGPKEAESAMELWTPAMPLAVGVLEGVDTGFQGNRALADQMAAVVADSGLGLVTQAKGLNTVQKLAQKDGVPSGVVFRDFDGAGQDPRAIRRFLDQAAFRAGQEGAVIMLGRLKPNTISALLLWGLQDRASRVQLAPVSASLKTGLNTQ